VKLSIQPYTYLMSQQCKYNHIRMYKMYHHLQHKLYMSLSTVFMAIGEKKMCGHSLFVNSGVQWMSGPKTK